MAVLIVVALVVFVVAQVLGGGSAPPQNKPKPKADPTSSSSCNLPDGNQAIPTKGPVAQWVLVAGFAEPRSNEFGPSKRTGLVGSCFARNPEGVLFTIANFVADSGAQGRSATALKARFFRDQNKPLAVRAVDKDGVSDNRGSSIAGFRFSDYTKNRATVEFVMQVTEGPHSGDYAALDVTVAWQDGDWRIVTPPTGRYEGTALKSITGYTKWNA